MQQVIQIEVPKLYSKQLEIHKNPAKRKVIASGRRTGKTLFTAVKYLKRRDRENWSESLLQENSGRIQFEILHKDATSNTD